MAAKHHITVAEIHEGNSSDLEKVGNCYQGLQETMSLKW